MNKYVKPEEFIRLYMLAYASGKGYDWVAKYSGLTVNQATQRTFSYRKKGVKLPKLKSRKKRANQHSKFNAIKLNKLVEELTKEFETKTETDTDNQ